MKPGEIEVSLEHGAIDYDAGIEKRRVHSEFAVPFCIEGPSATENVAILSADRALEVLRAKSVVRGVGSPSVTWNARHASDRSATGLDVFDDPLVTSSTTVAETDDANGYVKLGSGEWLWIVTTATAGTVDALEGVLICRLRTD